MPHGKASILLAIAALGEQTIRTLENGQAEPSACPATRADAAPLGLQVQHRMLRQAANHHW